MDELLKVAGNLILLGFGSFVGPSRADATGRAFAYVALADAGQPKWPRIGRSLTEAEEQGAYARKKGSIDRRDAEIRREAWQVRESSSASLLWPHSRIRGGLALPGLAPRVFAGLGSSGSVRNCVQASGLVVSRRITFLEMGETLPYLLMMGKVRNPRTIFTRRSASLW